MLSESDQIRVFNWIVGVMFGKNSLQHTCNTINLDALAELVDTARNAYHERTRPKPIKQEQ